MKKYLPYILLGILVLSLIMMMTTGSSFVKDFDARLSLRKRDKIPYGGYVAYENLTHKFPEARITSESSAPGYWSNLSEYQKDQVLIVISPNFKPNESEWKSIRRFIESGNDVLISTTAVSFPVEKETGVDVMMFAYHDNTVINPMVQPDSMQVSIAIPNGNKDVEYHYPGHDLSTWFYGFDSASSRILGRAQNGQVNLIGLKAGKGSLYLHLAPIAFSNYFLLHKENMEYYDRIMSLLSPKAMTVVWDEYFISRKNAEPEEAEQPEKGWLSVLMNLKNPEGKKSFATAFWLLLGILLLFTISEMRRKQRQIPIIKKPANDSLDFVKTIGRLYHDKGDHANLCRKMTAYFLEHVRSRYKMPTQNLNEDFVKELVYKSGVDEHMVRDILGFIEKLYTGGAVTAQGMAWYHEKLENFYKHS